MSEKIKAIIKRPDEKHGHVCWVSNTLKNLQGLVEGKIETYKPPVLDDTIILCNEEGKLMGLKPNVYIGNPPIDELLVGTIVVVGVDGEEFCDCPISFATWKWLLYKWGNY